VEFVVKFGVTKVGPVANGVVEVIESNHEIVPKFVDAVIDAVVPSQIGVTGFIVTVGTWFIVAVIAVLVPEVQPDGKESTS
jgi:hypothetical protein